MTTLSNSYRKQKSKEEKKKGQQHRPVQISVSHCFADTKCHGRQCLLVVNIPTFPLPPELGYTVVSSPVTPQAVSNAEGNVELQERCTSSGSAGDSQPRCSGRGSYVTGQLPGSPAIRRSETKVPLLLLPLHTPVPEREDFVLESPRRESHPKPNK